MCILNAALLFLLASPGVAFAQDHGAAQPAATEQHPAGHEPATATTPEKKAPKGKKAAKKAAEHEPTTITISQDKLQLIGVRTAIASLRPLGREIRTVGKVDVDETRLAYVNTKITGWVRKLFIDYTGQPVEKGQPLLAIYSPDLVSAQEEYLLALRSRKEAPGEFRELAESQDSMLESSRRRLLLWDITPGQIEELEQTGKPQTEMTILAPISGIVLEKMVLDGAYIMPGMNLYKIADLSTVWIIADIYEYELPFVRVGEKARVDLSYTAGRSLTATVSYISPTLDPMTRTAKVRLAVPNPGLMLKPEMFVTVELMAGAGSRLAVPAEAILDSGLRQILYVEKKPGVYEMRAVTVGARGGGYVEIIRGVRSGERVVTSGNFLIDSETQLRAGPEGGGHQH
jgi:Cu(I)/Ag(I) efflux system membrane fusion protein